ncbi:MAG: SpoIID/LytB domain-containing protein [Lachnospiraceae bacterium]|nr:SpoIID/LytB domain-containing protein [Lachnospiraceae bacterium]
MRLISNVFVVTGVLIGFPLLFYFAFHGVDFNRLPNIKEVESGYLIKSEDGKTYDLDQYIVGVLPSEIGMESSYEAIKAQAVIVRTSILQQMNGEKETDASKLEETYVSQEKLREEYGEKEYLNYEEILTKAVLETRGMVMKADQKYIVPLYHQVSIGTTISAKELYGKDISYLQAADSSADVESEDYMRVETWKYEDALSLIKKEKKNTKITEEQLEKNIVVISKTGSGYVKKIKVGDQEFSGEEWKLMFDLNSTNFYIEDYDNQMRIITLGKGHGLGLSQYGANEMAKKGDSFKKILKHYYAGIKFANAYK